MEQQTEHQAVESGQKDNHDIVVEIKALQKSFGSKQVLKNINLELKKGENVVILGKSGTGKSVTIECIVGLLTPDAGKLLVFGEDVTKLGETEWKALRMKIGFLFQSGALYDSMSVRENIEFPLTRILRWADRDKIEERVKEVLENVGLEDAADKMPSDLSGGMRKRAGLARTLAIKPEIMLYDEPTTGLDPITSREISQLILKVQRQNKTSSIIITHDMDCARIVSDRILVMDDGKYVAEGTFAELRNSKNEAVSSYFTE